MGCAIIGCVESLKGRLLVAAPMIVDPNFSRTVVLIVDHDGDGALGVVLNRPSETAVADALPGWEGVSADPTLVFVGGPVQPEAGVCLAVPKAGSDPPGFEDLLGWAGSLELTQDPALVAPAMERLRVFAGYAGWSAGQLEAELADEGWIVVDAVPEDAFDPDPDTLWRRVLQRQGGEYRLLAVYPPHPSLN